MKLSFTIGRYMTGSYLINLVGMLFGLLSLIYLFDTIELIRRASKYDTVPLSLVLQMGLFKLPEVGQILFPFAILFSAILTLWQFNRRSELVVLRSSGFSIWQILFPLIALAIMIGCLQITVINPVGSVLLSKYERFKDQYIKQQDEQIALFSGGLWLRQTVHYKQETSVIENDKQPTRSEGYVILHARKIDQKNWILKEVSAYYFNSDNEFVMRVEADQSTLEKGRWQFKDVHILGKAGQTRQTATYNLPTYLTVKDIEESFSAPEAMSFWELPSHIRTLEETGFNASRLRVYYQNLLAQPLFLAAMIILAATVAMRPYRSGGTFMLVMIGVFMGFVVFFLSSYLQALGFSGQLPPALAAWAPALIFILLGLTALINLEDG
ncbi:MAG: LPS export ABC transporter permease LptG [Micavibrio sp.]|nr:LPS export ABC transporter permease LptG [Micavibrio sp.]